MWSYNYDYLCHHGILGQKWGVRRFQNTDGSYTPAGKERYNKNFSIPKGKIVYRASLSGTNNFMSRKYTYINNTDEYSEHNINTSDGFAGRFNYDFELKTKKTLKIATLGSFLRCTNKTYNTNYKNISEVPHKYREGDHTGGNKNLKYFEKIIDNLKKEGYDGVADPIDYNADINNNEKAIATIIFDPKDKLEIINKYNR